MLSLLAVALFGAQFTAARASDPITEEAAHAIGVDADVYFYPLLSMDITRKQFTNIEPEGVRQRPDEYVRQRAGISASRFQGRRTFEFRHALFHRLAGFNQGAPGRLRTGH
jgi:hypothetical protein